MQIYKGACVCACAQTYVHAYNFNLEHQHIHRIFLSLILGACHFSVSFRNYHRKNDSTGGKKSTLQVKLAKSRIKGELLGLCLTPRHLWQETDLCFSHLGHALIQKSWMVIWAHQSHF